VSQKGGKVLLDTLIATSTKHELVVKSLDTKFDVTTVCSFPAYSETEIRTCLVLKSMDSANTIE